MQAIVDGADLHAQQVGNLPLRITIQIEELCHYAFGIRQLTDGIVHGSGQRDSSGIYRIYGSFHHIIQRHYRHALAPQQACCTVGDNCAQPHREHLRLPQAWKMEIGLMNASCTISCADSRSPLMAWA